MANSTTKIDIDEARSATNKGQYTIIRKIGKGAFGTVFLAEDKEHHQVAIKLIKASVSILEIFLGKQPSQLRDAYQEAQKLLQLRHKNIVEIIQRYKFSTSFFTQGLAIVTEYYSKGSLERCLKSLKQPPDVMQRLNWYEQLADGLAFIHEEGIAHRDLKPANILVDSTYKLKIGDVGLAKAIWDIESDSGEHEDMTFERYMSSVAGTPLYMAPEVWRKEYRITCDVFSIGLVFVMIAECPDPLYPRVPNYAHGLGCWLENKTPSRSKRATELLDPPLRTARVDEKGLFDKMLRYDTHFRLTMPQVKKEIEKIKTTCSAEPKIYQFQIVIVGDSGVGKSCILRQFTEGSFSDLTVPTLGIDFEIKTITIDGHRLKLQLWDTAGQERYHTISPAFYRHAVGAIMVFDITNEHSFKRIPEWLDEVVKYTEPHKPIFILVGNKSDQENDRQVSSNDARKLANSKDIDYMETSAKSSSGIDDVFDLLAKRIYEAVQDGRVKIEEGWNGVKIVDKVPFEVQSISLHQSQSGIQQKPGCSC